jgi:hypothetical protein
MINQMYFICIWTPVMIYLYIYYFVLTLNIYSTIQQ